METPTTFVEIPIEPGLVLIPVKMPPDRMADFYEMYGRWLRGVQQEAKPPEGADDADEHSWRDRRPWDPMGDVELARTAWAGFPVRAKQVFSTLIDNPTVKFTGDELAVMHAIPNGKYGVAGVLAHPGRQLKSLGRQHHFHAEALSEGGSNYWMDLDVAELFRQARDF